jgi:beta-1,4-N-acetylglucosaminyltransferase
MILVIVGLMYGFDRLVREIDRISTNISEDIIMQIGNTKYEPKNVKYYRFVTEDQINKLYNDARIIICHAGVGTILSSLLRNKLVIVVPRRMKYGEHVDDHQLEIAKELEKDGIIKAVYDIDKINQTLTEISNISFNGRKTGNNLLTKKLKEYLKSIE